MLKYSIVLILFFFFCWRIQPSPTYQDKEARCRTLPGISLKYIYTNRSGDILEAQTSYLKHGIVLWHVCQDHSQGQNLPSFMFRSNPNGSYSLTIEDSVLYWYYNAFQKTVILDMNSDSSYELMSASTEIRKIKSEIKGDHLIYTIEIKSTEVEPEYVKYARYSHNLIEFSPKLGFLKATVLDKQGNITWEVTLQSINNWSISELLETDACLIEPWCGY